VQRLGDWGGYHSAAAGVVAGVDEGAAGLSAAEDIGQK